MPRGGLRAFGPYKRRERWYLVLTERGARSTETFASKAAAERAKRRIVAEAAAEELTVADALDMYNAMRKAQGAVPVSLETTGYRIRALIPEQSTEVARITARHAQTLYDDAVSRVAVATQHSYLREVRGLWNMLVRKGLVRTNVWHAVERVGRANAGKPQLTIDETRIMLAFCERHCERLEVTAVWLALVFGLRSSEVLGIRPVDIDDNGTAVRVRRSKKRVQSISVLRLPEVMQPALAYHAPHGLFAGRTATWLRYHCHRICDEAEVSRVTPHGLRGSYASTRVLQAVAQELGHTSIYTTQSHYVRPGLVEQVESEARARALLH